MSDGVFAGETVIELEREEKYKTSLKERLQRITSYEHSAHNPQGQKKSADGEHLSVLHFNKNNLLWGPETTESKT